jgi:hypothetical protein
MFKRNPTNVLYTKQPARFHTHIHHSLTMKISYKKSLTSGKITNKKRWLEYSGALSLSTLNSTMQVLFPLAHFS